MSKRDSLEDFIAKAIAIHGEKYSYDEVTEYTNSSTKIPIRCEKHGIFEQTPSHHLQGEGCPKCASTTSQPEENLYLLLCEKFGKDNVKRQYNEDERYPFHCDFYIVSQDLFIELNANWTHGTHFFKEDNPKDREQLMQWQQKAKESTFYAAAIDTWTRRDSLKRKTAEENNLNYLVFWDNDLTDAKEWLASLNNTNNKQ